MEKLFNYYLFGWKGESEIKNNEFCLVCIIAVSYTHLRAHETKANLVCRLLLEKKKKTQTFTVLL